MTKGISIFLSVFLLSNKVAGNVCNAFGKYDVLVNCTEIPTHLILDMSGQNNAWLLERLRYITKISQLTIKNFEGKIIDFFPNLTVIETDLTFERNAKLEGFLFPKLAKIGGYVNFETDGYLFNLRKNKENIKYIHDLERSMGLTNACLKVNVKVEEDKDLREFKIFAMKLELMRVVLITFICAGMLLMCIPCIIMGKHIRNQKDKRKPFPIINFCKAVREDSYIR